MAPARFHKRGAEARKADRGRSGIRGPRIPEKPPPRFWYSPSSNPRKTSCRDSGIRGALIPEKPTAAILRFVVLESRKSRPPRFWDSSPSNPRKAGRRGPGIRSARIPDTPGENNQVLAWDSCTLMQFRPTESIHDPETQSASAWNSETTKILRFGGIESQKT